MENLYSKRHLFGDVAQKAKDSEKFTIITVAKIDEVFLRESLTIGLGVLCSNVPSRPGVFVAYGEFTSEQISVVMGGANFNCEVITGKSNLDALFIASAP